MKGRRERDGEEVEIKSVDWCAPWCRWHFFSTEGAVPGVILFVLCVFVFELCLHCPLDSLYGLQQWMVVMVAAACVWFDWWCWWNSSAGCAAAGAGAAGGFCGLPLSGTPDAVVKCVGGVGEDTDVFMVCSPFNF